MAVRTVCPRPPTGVWLKSPLISLHIAICLVILSCVTTSNAQIPADNLFSLKSLRSTYCLDVDGANNVEVTTCTTLPEQTYYMGTNNVMVATSDGRCLLQNAGNVEHATCDTANVNQQWTPQYQSPQSSLILQFVNVGNGQCLTALGTNIGGNVGTSACTGSPDDSWTRVDRSAQSLGTIVSGENARQWDIVDGGSTIEVHLVQDRYVATMGQNNAITTAFLATLTSLQSEATGWNAVVLPLLDHTHVVRTSDTVVTVTLPAAAGYLITASEYINVAVPSSALQSGKTALTSTRPIVFNADCLEVPGIRFSTRAWTQTACSTAGPINWWWDQFFALPVGPAGTYCNEFVTGLNTLNSQGTCGGPNNNLGYKFSLTFQPLVGGNWEFRVGSDFGYGAAYYLDEVGVNYRCDDMWWATNWNNAAVFYSSPMTVTRDRSYRMDLIGLEGCCDGAMVVQYRTSSSGTWTDASVANLQDDTGVTSCGCWTNCTECTAHSECGWCADGNCDPSDTGPSNTDSSLGQCVSGSQAGPESGNCSRWLYGDCKNTPEVIVIQAIDADDKDAIYSDGDIIAIQFNNDTNAPTLETKARVDNMLFFSEYIGDDYSGIWVNASYLEIHIIDTGTANPQIGVMTVTVLNQIAPILTDAGGCGFPTTSTAGTVLVGSWGDPARLNITKEANVTQADAGDTVLFTMLLQHSPSTGNFAYNMTVTDIMPEHLQLVPGTVTASSASSAFLNITRGNAATDTSIEVFLARMETTQTLTVTFEGSFADTIVLGDYLINTGYVNHSALSPELSDEASSFPVLVNGNEVVTLTLVNTSLSESAQNQYTAGVEDLSIAETIVYGIQVDLPEGTNTVTVALELPAYFDITAAGITHLGSQLAVTPGPLVIENDTSGMSRAYLALGTFVNPGDNIADERDRITIDFTAAIRDTGAATTGTSGVATARLTQSQKDMTQTIGFDIVEPALQISVVANVSSASTTHPIGVTATISHTGASRGAAYNVTALSDMLSSLGLVLIPGTVNWSGSSGSTTATVVAGNGASDNRVEVVADVVPNGDTLVVTFDTYLTSAWRVTCSSACHPGCCPDVTTSVGGSYNSAPPAEALTPTRSYAISDVTDTVSLTVPGPVITAVIANDPDDGDTYASNADTIDIQFDVNTNQGPAVATTSDLDALFTFSHSIGTSYTGTYVSAQLIRITIVTIDRAVHNPPIGGLVVTVNAAANLRIQSGSPPASTSVSPVATGDWGLFAATATLSPGSLISSNFRTDLQVMAGGETIVVSLTGTRFETDIATNSALRDTLLNSIVSNVSDPFAWNNYLRSTLTSSDIVRNAGGDQVTITLPANNNYSIATGTGEGLTMASVPASLIWSPSSVTPVAEELAIYRTYPTVTIANVLEEDLFAGMAVISLTLTNEAWAPSGAEFDAQRQTIIDAISSPYSTDTHAWNFSIASAPIPVASVSRVSDTLVQITVPAQSSYVNQDPETMLLSELPASVRTRATTPVPSTTFTISDALGTGTLSGNALPSSRQQDIRGGSQEFYITLTHDHWVDGAAFDAQRAAILDGVTAVTGANVRGWENGKVNMTVASVVRISDQVVYVNITEIPDYYTEIVETVVVTVPAAAVLDGRAINAGNFTIDLGTVCGDSVVEVIEECDDGNTIDGDGCTSSCNIESGFSCYPPSGGSCRPFRCWTNSISHPLCCSLSVNDCPQFQSFKPAT